jgi:hypothetical protein
MCEVVIRGEGEEFLGMTLLGRSALGAGDYWDGNWVKALVDVHVGGFRGSVDGDLRAEELLRFHRQFELLQQSLRGHAWFETYERWLSIHVAGDGRGHMEVRSVIRDQPVMGNTLDCILVTDQSFTRATVAALAAAVRRFPVIGEP